MTFLRGRWVSHLCNAKALILAGVLTGCAATSDRVVVTESASTAPSPAATAPQAIEALRPELSRTGFIVPKEPGESSERLKGSYSTFSLSLTPYALGGKAIEWASDASLGALNPLVVSPQSVVGPDIVRLLFGTNRKVSDATHGSLRDAMTSTRSSDVAFGYVDVSVPPNHDVGDIDRPKLWKLEFSEDPTEHMMIRDITLVEASRFADLIKEYRGPDATKPSVLFVHGYNVSFDDAALRTAQIAYDLGIDSVPAFFSWASLADPALYTQDENTALQSVPDFKKFLRLFAANSSDRIFLVAHSMGSRIVTQALTEMIQAEPQVATRVVQLVLAAPDLDASVFKEQIVPAFKGQNIPVTLYASSRDKTLKASSRIHGCCRAGLGGSNIVIAEGMESIDATSVDTSFLGHSYFAETRPLLTDLNLLLARGMRAASRPLLRGRPVRNPTHYYFRQ